GDERAADAAADDGDLAARIALEPGKRVHQAVLDCPVRIAAFQFHGGLRLIRSPCARNPPGSTVLGEGKGGRVRTFAGRDKATRRATGPSGSHCRPASGSPGTGAWAFFSSPCSWSRPWPHPPNRRSCPPGS